MNSPDIKKLHRIDENEKPLEADPNQGGAGLWYSRLNLPGRDDYYEDGLLDISTVPRQHHIDLANRLIEERHGYLLAESLSLFYGIDPTEIAHKLIDSNQGAAVVRNIYNFPGINPVEFVDELINTNQGATVAENLNLFKGVNHSEIAQKLIDTNQVGAVASYIDNFYDLDKSIADSLIHANRGTAVMRDLDHFSDLNPVEIVDELINTNQGYDVAMNLSLFKSVYHSEIAQKLIDTGQGETLAINLSDFQGINHAEVAQKLIERGQELSVVKYLGNFNDSDHATIVNNLIDIGQGGIVAASFCGSWAVKDSEVVQKLISTGQTKVVADSLYRFQYLDTATAFTLIDAGYTQEVASNLHTFMNLNNLEIANKLLDLGEDTVLLKNLFSFRNLDANLIDKLIDLGHGGAIAGCLSHTGNSLPTLNQAIADKLINEGRGSVVAYHANKFEGLDHNYLAQRLIETGKTDAVIEGLSYGSLTRLDTNTAIKLIGAGKIVDVLNKSRNFKDLDYMKIANDLIDRGQGALVGDNLSRFGDRLDSNVASKLIAVGEIKAVSERLGQFKKLDSTIATQLIDAGMGSAVISHWMRFTDLNSTEIANRLFDTKQGSIVADNLSHFPNLNNTEIAQKLIDAGQIEAVKRNLKMLNGFTALSVGIAINLIDAGYGAEVAKNIYNFHNLDKSVASRLVQIGKGYEVASNLNLFNDVDDIQFVSEIIEARQGEAVLSNLSAFPGLNRADLLRQLADTEQFKAIAKHLEKFQDLDNSLADKLIKAGEGASVAPYLSHFKDIDPEKILTDLIETKQGVAVAQNPEKFHTHSQSDIATRLINAGDAQFVAACLTRFYDLDITIADRLIDAGYSEAVGEKLNSFKVPTLEIAKKLIDLNKARAVARGIRLFKGLDQADIAQRLIDAGHSWEVVRVLDHFTELSHTEIAQKLIDAGEVGILISSIHDFKDLSTDIAFKLINAGHSSVLAQNLDHFAILDSAVAAKLIEEGEVTAIVENVHRFSNLSKVPFLGDIYKIQPPSNNAENDPWRLHLLPLLKHTGDTHDQRVQHAVLKYIKTFGLVYVKDLYDVFKRVMVEGDISEDTQAELRSFGINPNMQRDAVLQELDKVSKSYTKNILEGSVPESLTTPLGKALFTKEFVPQSTWDRRFNNWYEMGSSSLENYQVPKFLKTQMIDLVEKGEATELEAEELEAQRRTVFENKETGTRIATFKSIMADALEGFTLSQVQAAIATRVEKQKALIATKDPSTQEKIIDSIQKAVDRDEELIEALQGLHSHEDIVEAEIQKEGVRGEAEIEALQRLHAYEDIVEAGLPNVPLLYQEMAVLLAERNGKEENLSRWLRAFAIKQMLRKTPGLREVFSDIRIKEAVDYDTVSILAEITSHTIEHEYFDNQEPGLSDIVKTTLRKLLMADKVHKAAGSKEDTDYFTKVLKDLEKIDNPTGNARVTSIQFVPVGGLGRLTAGNVGNACYTSQTESLANGKFRDTHMMMIVKKRTDGSEQIVGSILGIIAQTAVPPYGTPVYVMRANNPQENFLSTVDINSYVDASVKALIQQAVDCRNENVLLDYESDIKVTIPMESSSNASMTNRPRVHELLYKMFKDCERVPLLDTPDTEFNGYPVWSRAVCIFEIKDGKEYYYGNHTETPAHELRS